MKLNELLEELDRYGVYGKPSKKYTTDGSQSPLTGPGDASWKKAKKNIFNWFKRPYLTNGSKNNYMLPIKKKINENLDSATEAEQLSSVEHYCDNIKYIRNPSEAVSLAAVSQCPDTIAYIPNNLITSKIKSVVLKHLVGSSNDYVKFYLFNILKQKNLDWTELDVIEKTLKTREHPVYRNKITEAERILPPLSTAGEADQIEGVRRNVSNILYISKPSEAVQLAAAETSGRALDFIIKEGIKPSEAVQLAAINRDCWSIQYLLRNGIVPSEKVQLAAIERDSDILQELVGHNITVGEKVQLTAVNKSGWLIKFITNPSEDVQIAAFNNNTNSFRFVKNDSITPKVKSVVIKHVLAMAKHRPTMTLTMLNMLRDKELDWPELNIIRKNIVGKK
jgi:hypothetical protein